MEEIVKMVADYYDIQPEVLMKSRSKKRRIILPRQVAIYLVAEISKFGPTDMGRMFNVNHATIIHTKRVIKDQCDVDKKMRKDIEILLLKSTDVKIVKPVWFCKQVKMQIKGKTS